MDIDNVISYLNNLNIEIEVQKQENMELRYENATLRDRIKELERKVS